MTAVSAIDDLTAAAVREAISLAQSGRIAAACEVGERALSDGGDGTTLHAMLGMLRCKSKEFQAALPHLRAAHSGRPGDIQILGNLVLALVETGSPEEAFALASPQRAKADRTLTIARYRGYVSQLLGDCRAASGAYEMVVAAAPADWQSWNNLGNARLLCGDFKGAIAAFERSVAINATAAETWLNLARALIKDRQLDEAEAKLRETAERFPSDARPLKELYDLMRSRERRDEALHEVLEQAVARAPNDRELMLALGGHRMLAQQFDAAEKACRAVLAADPHDADAWLDLATFWEHTAPERLSDLLNEIESAGVPSPVPDVVRAFVCRREKKYAEGLTAIEKVPRGFKPWMVEDLRGQFLDKLGHYDEAFAAFTRMNEAEVAETFDPLLKAEYYRSAQRQRLKAMTADWLASWAVGPVPTGRPAPVFLVGFPRSGTTLLDTMLMGHPDVSVMEEKPVLDLISREIGGFDGIASMNAQAVERARRQYFAGVERVGGDATRKVLIDKNPFHLMQVPLIHRLFPDAQFVLALRHPADVLLSCYISSFRLTPQLGNFLPLDTAAEFYDLAFGTWERSRELMTVDVQTVVYEQLVEDPEGQLRPVASALGLEWRNEMLDHAGTAASRDLIATASYAQVTEPIYRRSVGRWEQYRAHLEPVLPVLRPWAEKFGYSI